MMRQIVIPTVWHKSNMIIPDVTSDISDQLEVENFVEISLKRKMKEAIIRYSLSTCFTRSETGNLRGRAFSMSPRTSSEKNTNISDFFLI